MTSYRFVNLPIIEANRSTLMQNVLIFIIILFISTTANANGKLIFSTGKEATIQNISELVLIEAYRKIGYDIKVDRIPNARCLIESNDGQYDGEVSRIKGINKKFSNLIRVPVSVNFLEGYAFSKNKDLKITSWEDLRQYKVLCVKGVKVVEKYLDKLNIVYTNVTFFTQAVKLLQDGRYDVAVLPRYNGACAIREAKITDVGPVGSPLIKIKLYHYLHKKNADIVTRIQVALVDMEKNGRIAEIRAKYMKKHNY